VYTVQEFGRSLVATGDLDPIYLMLNGAKLDPATVQRWSLAYWMFYHAGVASRIAEAGSKKFWSTVQQAQDEKWPRGTERRHFKGAQSQQAINALREQYLSPEDAVAWVMLGVADKTIPKKVRLAAGYSDGQIPPQPFTVIRDRVMSWRGFGPWIAFKVADMTDAVLGVPVDFSSAAEYLFDDPRKGAGWVFAQRHGAEIRDAISTVRLNPGQELEGESLDFVKSWYDGCDSAERHNMMEDTLEFLGQELGHLMCPHADRPLALQEYETILCKYKSHLNGKYPVGKDTKEILHGLRPEHGWGDLAAQLHDALLTASTDRLLVGR
jgi:hypothetical protein